ncbi:hypothetical protein ES707_02701 [subsurface metagenome]
MNILVLDHIKNIQLDTSKPPVNNYQAPMYLREGLHFLAYTVRVNEIEFSRRLPTTTTTYWGSAINPRIVCCFNWFSTSVVNYLRFVGLVNIMTQKGWTSLDVRQPQNHKLTKNHCTQYVKEVVPEIYVWRNKVSAHFAITDPDRKDNLATLEYSIMNAISYSRPYFEAGGFMWTTRGDKSELPKWALTQTYEELANRLWPDLSLPAV